MSKWAFIGDQSYPRRCFSLVPIGQQSSVPDPVERKLEKAEPSSYMGTLQKSQEVKTLKRKHSDPVPVARLGEQQAHNTIEPPPIEIGVVTWNINHTGKDSQPALKAKCIKWLFSQHSWVDVLVLQEVNTDVPYLSGSGLKTVTGPFMKSISSAAEPEELDGHYEWFDKEGACAWIGQREYYVAVFRKTVVHTGVRVFERNKLRKEYSDPFFWAKEEEEKDLKEKARKAKLADRKFKPLKEWKLKFPTCRPVVVHDFKTLDGRRFSVAVIHTTPEGTGLGRMGEYDQISGFLEVAAADQRRSWIIAGDYYIDEDATVTSNSDVMNRPTADKFGFRIPQMGLKLVSSVSATNQSTSLPSIPDSLLTSSQKEKKSKTRKLTGEHKETPEQRSSMLKQLYALDQQLKNRETTREKANKEQPEFAMRLSDRVLIPDGEKIWSVVNKKADFFICSANLLFGQAGVIRPGGGILPVDPNHNALNWWTNISDHMPVGGIFGTKLKCEKWRLAEMRHIVDGREARAVAELEEIAEEAVAELYRSARALCGYVINQKIYSPLVVSTICFVDALLSNDDLKKYSPPRFDFPREEWQQFANKASQEAVLDYWLKCQARTFEGEYPSQYPTDDNSEATVREVKNICLQLPKLMLSLEMFDLTPESDTYEDVHM